MVWWLHNVKSVSRNKLISQQCECLFHRPYQFCHHLHEFQRFLLFFKGFRPYFNLTSNAKIVSGLRDSRQLLSEEDSAESNHPTAAFRPGLFRVSHGFTDSTSKSDMCSSWNNTKKGKPEAKHEEHENENQKDEQLKLTGPKNLNTTATRGKYADFLMLEEERIHLNHFA